MENINLKELFKQEFSKMVAVISKLYGLAHIEIAEDVVSDTFLLAAETWESKGVPDNPTAWLYAVAKQKTLYHFRRNKIFDERVAPDVKHNAEKTTDEPDFSPKHIKDSQLQMLFAICNPAIASEAQIGLALRILCGFGIDEIADAFMSNKETINKRLFRAKEKLRTETVVIELPPKNEISARLDNVLHIIYLLFNEGYYSKTESSILRKDFCIEALRLGLMLRDNEITNEPKTNALIALMCFHASRFDARQDNENAYILYEAQNPDLWDNDMIQRGLYYLNTSMQGDEVTSYHIEAQIAYHHCLNDNTPNKWQSILQLYNQLLLINYSPAVALNRTYALYRSDGREVALVEAEKLKLQNNHFYHILLGELYTSIDNAKARTNFEMAYSLAKTTAEKTGISLKISKL